MTLNNTVFDGQLVFSRGGSAWSHGPDGKMVEHPQNLPRIGYDPETGLPDGLVIEAGATNYIQNNRDTGFGNGGAHSSAETTEIEPLIAGAKVWRLSRTASLDSNMSNTWSAIVGVSTNVVASCWVFLPTTCTATEIRIGADGASASGAFQGYDLAKKGTFQRVWRAVTTNATTANHGYQLRVNGMPEGDYLYATLLQVESGARVTSTILTTGTTATRSGDVCRVSDAAFQRVFPLTDPRTNLVRGSNNFDNSVWGVKSSITVTPNYAADPNGGGLIACRILETAANTDHYIEQGLSADGMPAGATISASVMVKADGRTALNMTMYGASYTGSFSIMVNDLDTTPTHNAGASSNGATIQAVQVHPVGVSGWHRVVISGTLPTAGGRLRIAMINSSTTYAGDITKGVILANAQVEVSPVTLPINLAANPEAAQNWSRSRVTCTANATAEPGLTGYLTADLITDTDDPTNAQHATWTSAAVTPGQMYTASVSVKASTSSDVAVLFLNSNFSASLTCRVNLATGAITILTKSAGANTVLVDGHVIPQGDGWYRIYLTGNPDVTTSNMSVAVYLNGGSSYVGTGAVSVFVHGAMISPTHTEYVPISSLVSSPVPTTTAGPATEYVGQAAQGFAVIEATVGMATPTSTAGQNIIQLDDGTNNTRVLVRNNGGSNFITAYSLPLSTNGVHVGTLAPGVPFRIALTWRYGTCRIVGPGGVVTVLASGSNKPRPYMRLGVSASSNEQLCGKIRDFAMGAKFLTDAQLQAAAVVGADIATATR